MPEEETAIQNQLPALADHERRKINLESRIDEARRRHQQELAALSYELYEVQREIQHGLLGIDSGKVLLAEHVLQVRGLYATAGDDRAGNDRADVIDAAVQDILNNAPMLRERYCIGSKIGRPLDIELATSLRTTRKILPVEVPAAGSPTLEVAHQQEYRDVRARDLTAEEIEAAVYYLRNLEKIQRAQADAQGLAENKVRAAFTVGAAS